MENIVAQADRAFVEEEFERAIQLYSQVGRDMTRQRGHWSPPCARDLTEPLPLPQQALEAAPSNANIWESRAHAHIKAEDYLEAANDAAKAIELDPGMAKAHLRRG